MNKKLDDQEEGILYPIPITFVELTAKNKIKKFINSKKKKLIFPFVVFSLFFMSYYFYYLSLEKCLDGFDFCGMKSKWILLKLTQAIISYIISSVLLELMILKIISKLHLFHLIVIYKLFYNYSHGLDFHDHGYFNFIGLISIITLILIALLPFNVFLILYKKRKKYVIYFIFFFYLYFSFIIYILVNHTLIVKIGRKD